LGITKEMRVYVRGAEVNFVISCEGYIGDKNENL